MESFEYKVRQNKPNKFKNCLFSTKEKPSPQKSNSSSIVDAFLQPVDLTKKKKSKTTRQNWESSKVENNMSWLHTKPYLLGMVQAGNFSSWAELSQEPLELSRADYA